MRARSIVQPWRRGFKYLAGASSLGVLAVVLVAPQAIATPTPKAPPGMKNGAVDGAGTVAIPSGATSVMSKQKWLQKYGLKMPKNPGGKWISASAQYASQMRAQLSQVWLPDFSADRANGDIAGLVAAYLLDIKDSRFNSSDGQSSAQGNIFTTAAENLKFLVTGDRRFLTMARKIVNGLS